MIILMMVMMIFISLQTRLMNQRHLKVAIVEGAASPVIYTSASDCFLQVN